METFLIEFSYNSIPYAGVVTPFLNDDKMCYSVNLDSENQDSGLEITACPPQTDSGEWSYSCPDGQPPPASYDKSLLQEIGEAIEKHEVTNGGQGS